MPAPRRNQTLLDHLNQQAEVQPVNQILSIDRYYKSADLCLAQAQAYRAVKNDEQLYVILGRFARLVIEVITKHKDFQKNDRRYQNHVRLLRDAYMAELETLKQALVLREVPQPSLHSTARPSHALPISASNLPQMDWSFVHTPAGPPAPSDPFATATLQLALPSVAPPSSTYDPFSLTPNPTPTTYPSTTPSSSYGYASQSTLSRHTLYAPPSTSSTYASYAPPPTYAPSRPLSYPQLDTTPVRPPTDLLSFSEAPPSTTAQPPGILDALPPIVHPSAGPSLGPQEVEVHTMRPTDPTPATCISCPSPPPSAVPPPPPTDPAPGGVKEYIKRAELRDVHVSVALMEEFLRYAQANTLKGIESCGILAGHLSANDSIFAITTLIIPKQSGTTDTVQALNEEEIFDVQMTRELYPLGWIHTHPTQTCFLSSVDVHTQCGYQTMLDEAVAIVMAPTDRKNKCGIFRLSTPGGLSLVQKCPLRGFHAHPPTDTGQEIYELSGHVFLNPRTKHDVVDLR